MEGPFGPAEYVKHLDFMSIVSEWVIFVSEGITKVNHDRDWPQINTRGHDTMTQKCEYQFDVLKSVEDLS